MVALGGLGYGGWLYYQQDEELNQARANINNLNARISTLQDQLTTAQADTAKIQGQYEAEKASAYALQVALKASEDRVAALELELDTIHALLDTSQNDIASEIIQLNAKLAEAKAELANLANTNAELVTARNAAVAALTKVTSPRHFDTKAQLEEWLRLDDTDTNPAYAFLEPADKAFILQVKALRDGFLLPAAIDADGQYIYSWNIAFVKENQNVYVIFADTDEIIELAKFEQPLIQQPLS